MCEFYGVETLDGFGAFTRAEIAAAALALAYVKRTQFEARPALSAPTRRARGTSLEIDPATRANLELTRTLSGAREGSLLATIDLTVTPAGARLLAERLASPLTDPDAINRRLDSLDFLVEAAPMRDALRRALAARARFSARPRAPEPRSRRPARPRRRPRRACRGGGAREHSRGCSGSSARASCCLCAAAAPIASALERDLEATLADDLPLVKRDGGFVRPGASPALDEARSAARRKPPRHRRIAGLLRRARGGEAAQDQAQQFSRLLHRNAAGAGETLLKAPLNSTFIHRQTMAGAMRFTTNALVDLEAGIASAADRALALELEAFERLRQACLAEAERLRGLGAALAEIDVAAALAELAVKRNWTRPLVDASLSFQDRERAPSGGRGGAEGGGRAVRRQ